MRVIDADALEELFREVIGGIAKKPEMNGNLEHMVRASAMVIEMIKDAPTIEERKTGEWSVEFSPAYKGGAYCECSQCNYKFAMGAYFEPDEWKFCPNCGADMRGEQDG